MWTSMFEALSADLARPRFARVVAAARAAVDWLAEPGERERALVERAEAADAGALDALGEKARAGRKLDEDEWLIAAAWGELLFTLKHAEREFADARFPAAARACASLRAAAEKFPFAKALAQLAADWSPTVGAALFVRACASLEIFGDAALYKKVFGLMRSNGAFWPAFVAAACLKSPGVAARAPLGELSSSELALLTLLDNFHFLDGKD